MNIEFKWETFLEEDDTWEALFVKTPTKDWHLAEHHYGTENEDAIRKILESDSIDLQKLITNIVFGLTVCFCLLNYAGITNWSLVWVFSPIWIALLIQVTTIVIAMVVSVILSL